MYYSVKVIARPKTHRLLVMFTFDATQPTTETLIKPNEKQ